MACLSCHWCLARGEAGSARRGIPVCIERWRPPMGGEAEQELPEDEGEEPGIGQEGGRTSRERDAYAENGIAGGTPDDEVLPIGSKGVALDFPCDGCVVGEEEGDVSLFAALTADSLIPVKATRISRITRILDSECSLRSPQIRQILQIILDSENSANSEKDEKLSDD